MKLLEPGSRIDRYTVESVIGEGAFGTVCSARYEGPGGFNRRVALKVLLPRAKKVPQAMEMFHREARTAALLDHRSIIQVLDVGQDGPYPFLVMELVEGVNLEQLAVLLGGGLARWVRVGIVTDVARGLAYAHALRHEHCPNGIVHRDVKPPNILLGRQGVVKLSDFGLAKRLQDAHDDLTTVGVVKGTPGFMSPEQLRGEDSGGAMDVFALGVVLHWLLTARLPPREPGATLFGNVPPHILSDEHRAIIGACLAPDPGHRPTAEELVQTLTHELAALAPDAQVSSFSDVLARCVEQAMQRRDAQRDVEAEPGSEPADRPGTLTGEAPVMEFGAMQPPGGDGAAADVVAARPPGAAGVVPGSDPAAALHDTESDPSHDATVDTESEPTVALEHDTESNPSDPVTLVSAPSGGRAVSGAAAVWDQLRPSDVERDRTLLRQGAASAGARPDPSAPTVELGGVLDADATVPHGVLRVAPDAALHGSETLIKRSAAASAQGGGAAMTTDGAPPAPAAQPGRRWSALVVGSLALAVVGLISLAVMLVVWSSSGGGNAARRPGAGVAPVVEGGLAGARAVDMGPTARDLALRMDGGSEAAPARPDAGAADRGLPRPDAPRSTVRRGHGRRRPPPRRRSGYISVDSEPWSRVRLDGKPLGTTPLWRHRVSSGRHRLVLEGQQGRRATRRLRIKPGEHRNLGRIKLR